MNKLLKSRSSIFNIILLFFAWRFFLIIVLLFALNFVSLENSYRFLGGGSFNYKIAPELFSWANFDGEHYLSISIFGYKGLEQAFFPIYPLIISFFAKPFSHDLFTHLLNSTVVGLLISNISFLLSLIFFWKLLRIDYSKKLSYFTLLILLIFPTSFYFGALYNESLFLLLTALSFYSARKKRWFLASIFGMIASATRIFGILLLPALLIEIYLQKTRISKSFWLILIPLGLGAYMMYQYLTIGDPLAFYHIQPLVGEQRQSNLVILPQVYFRYIKMIFTVDLQSPIYQTILLEFIVGIAFFILPIYGYFKKIRLSYLFYGLVGFLITTVQGSFSSVPRYVIVFFPSFIALALLLNNLPKFLRILIILGSILLLLVETTLFLRGYWVA